MENWSIAVTMCMMWWCDTKDTVSQIHSGPIVYCPGTKALVDLTCHLRCMQKKCVLYCKLLVECLSFSCSFCNSQSNNSLNDKLVGCQLVGKTQVPFENPEVKKKLYSMITPTRNNTYKLCDGASIALLVRDGRFQTLPRKQNLFLLNPTLFWRQNSNLIFSLLQAIILRIFSLLLISIQFF